MPRPPGNALRRVLRARGARCLQRLPGAALRYRAGVPHRLPCLLNDPAPAAGRTWLTGARLFDGTAAPVRERVSLLVEDGRIAAIAGAGETPPEGARVIDAGGRTLLPGLIDAHQHVTASSRTWCKTANEAGTEAIWPGAAAHVVAQVLRELLRMGITTVRDVGGYDDLLVEARQAMRYGAFNGPRVLACGRIVSATCPGGRFFAGMYREADGGDEIRKAVREQMRYGADFIKVMTTGARSVELEDPDPAQLTREEIRVLVEESHRMGYRVAAHCEGMPGTEISIEEGIDTIEHGMYLNQRPDLLEAMARDGQVLVPTVSCLYGVAGLGERIGTDVEDDEYQGGGAVGVQRPPMPTWTKLLVDLAQYNVDQAALTIRAARAAGVAIAMGFDWGPPHRSALELLRMIHMGLTPREGLIAATSASAAALGLAEHVGTIEVGKLADLLIVDGDPLARPELLLERESIWLVTRLGAAVAGTSLERDPAEPKAA
jgi:imidazolonepropionase-like amidohydrolase